MSIFLTGATGFIGGHTLRALSEQGYSITCLVRRSSQSESNWHSKVQQLRTLPGVQVIEGEWTSPAAWLQHVAGHETVINTVGIIRESPKASFETVHTTVPIALFEAAARAGVQKIVQVSALGADEEARSRFHCSKRAADQCLTQLGVPYVILRPSFVYGPGDHSMAFFSQLARLPLSPIPGDGHYRVQPVHVNDLVRAMSFAMQRDDLSAVTVNVGGSQVLSFAALLDILAYQQGKQHGVRKVHIPWNFMRLLATITDGLGGHGPITGDELGMLRRENFADMRPFVDLFGFEPRPFSIGVTQRGLGFSESC